MPTRKLRLFGIQPVRRDVMIQRLRLCLEVGVAQGLQAPWHRPRSEVAPSLQRIGNILGKLGFKIVGGVVFADIVDRSVERHQRTPSMARMSRVVGWSAASKWASLQFRLRS